MMGDDFLWGQFCAAWRSALCRHRLEADSAQAAWQCEDSPLGCCSCTKWEVLYQPELSAVCSDSSLFRHLQS